MSKPYQKKYYRLLAVSFLLFAGGITWEFYYVNRLNDRPAILARVQKVMDEKTRHINAYLDHLTVELIKVGNDSGRLDSLTAKIKTPVDDFTIFIYRNDDLKYWSDNKVLLKATDKPEIGDEQMTFFNTGYYEFYKRSAGLYKIRGILLLKRSDTKFENKYVHNDFNSDFNLGENVLFGAGESSTQKFAVKNFKGSILFYLVFSKTIKRPVPLLLPVIFFLAIITFLMWLYTFVIYYAFVDFLRAFLIIPALIAAYVLLIIFRYPNALFELTLFSPFLYASSRLLNSLGHLLLATFIITFITLCFYTIVNRIRIGNKQNAESKWMSLIPVAAFLVIILYAVMVNSFLSGLVLNSKISFAVDDILNLSGYSFVGLFIIFMLMFSFYLVCEAALRYIMKTRFQFTTILILFIISQAIFLPGYYLFWYFGYYTHFSLVHYAITCGVIFLLGLVILNAQRKYTFYKAIWLVIVFAAYTSFILYNLTGQKEEEQRMAYADKLENEGDLLAEYLFEDIQNKMWHDEVLFSYFRNDNPIAYLNNNAQAAISNRLKQNYFTGYWSGYDIKIHALNHNGLPISNPVDSSVSIAVYEKIIRDKGERTQIDGLYSLKNNTGSSSYIANIEVNDPELNYQAAGNIIVELNSKVTKNELGYPGLLISQKQANKLEKQTYSYAIYKNNVLVSQSGNFGYMVTDDLYKSLARTPGDHFVARDKVSFLFRVLRNGDMIVVSKPLADYRVLFTIFSYIFTFFFLWYVFFFFSYRLITNSFQFNIDFKNRIQLTVTTIIIVIMLSIGSITIYNIIKNYDHSQNEKLLEKLSSVLLVIENESRNKPLLNDSIEKDLGFKFSELSNALNCDFNIYDTLGYLQYTTQPKVFDLNLLSNTLDRNAFNELKHSPKLNFVQNEKIGSLDYIAAYQPIRSGNKTVAYIDLPYFKNEADLKKQLSSILFTLINIYIPVFFGCVLLTIYLSQRLANPLQLIQTSLSKVRLDKSNALIEWHRNDEIGALVKEYNRMVLELERSAETLAQSERETAWREMARQVAHEIKNPLTPMKLSVQHMLRAMQDDHPDFRKMVKRFSENLVEQIDTLSNIATEFSNFAKMPKANNAVINLEAVLRSSAELYGAAGETKIIYHNSKKEMPVYADKGQLLRVFSNLLKNAMQAIPDPSHGLVTVTVNEDDHSYTVAISDNGIGIPDDKRDRIFAPNFTTKTTGTGLGLAMAKQIIEHIHGKLWFETKVNAGTTFFISLPKYSAQ